MKIQIVRLFEKSETTKLIERKKMRRWWSTIYAPFSKGNEIITPRFTIESIVIEKHLIWFYTINWINVKYDCDTSGWFRWAKFLKNRAMSRFGFEVKEICITDPFLPLYRQCQWRKQSKRTYEFSCFRACRLAVRLSRVNQWFWFNCMGGICFQLYFFPLFYFHCYLFFVSFYLLVVFLKSGPSDIL